MTARLRVLSIYDGFFAGGARILHSAVVAGLQSGGRQTHSVLSIHRQVRRETIVQRMEEDACYRRLREAGVPVAALRHRIGEARTARPLSPAELAAASRHAARADVVLSLKEQPLAVVNHAGFPDRPVIVCLHRSDPENQGAAFTELTTAIRSGRVTAAICCAESTKAAYQAAGIPGELLHVIRNGVDLVRFRPAAPDERRRLRAALGVPSRSRVVAFAARYDRMKDVPLFLAAARAFLARERRGHVVMCGAGMSPCNGELAADLQAAFRGAARLLRRVHLLGLQQDMRQVYAATDVVALTSRFGEAAPLCLIEGAMCGAVPVSTDVGDCASIVAGLGLVTPAEPDAVAAAWSEAVERRGEFAPALAGSRERFSETAMIASYSALVDRVRQGRAAPRAGHAGSEIRVLTRR